MAGSVAEQAAARARAAQIIEQELRRKYRVRDKGNSLWISCVLPEHGHEDATPSLKFNLDPNNSRAPLGFAYCFGCGGRRHWNTFAKERGLRQLSVLDQEVTERSDASLMLLRVRREAEAEWQTLESVARIEWGAQLLHDPPWPWRGISHKLLLRIGAKLYVNRHRQQRMVLPVYVRRQLVGAISALLEKSEDKSSPSYLNSEGEWAKSTGLFPYDTAAELVKQWGARTLVLTEGPRDALTAIHYRFPAMAILGSNNWTTVKRDLVLAVPGIKRVVVAMDSDDAGVRASNAAFLGLCDWIDTRVVDMRALAARAQVKKLDLGEPTDELLDILESMR